MYSFIVLYYYMILYVYSFQFFNTSSEHGSNIEELEGWKIKQVSFFLFCFLFLSKNKSKFNKTILTHSAKPYCQKKKAIWTYKDLVLRKKKVHLMCREICSAAYVYESRLSPVRCWRYLSIYPKVFFLFLFFFLVWFEVRQLEARKQRCGHLKNAKII